MMKKGFTLAEVLITLAIIGIVAALTIPSVVMNTQSQEFKTGLKKAVAVMNQAIGMSIALDGYSASGASSSNYLQNILASKMNVVSSDGLDAAPDAALAADNTVTGTYFTVADGMQFIFPDKAIGTGPTMDADAGSCADGASKTKEACEAVTTCGEAGNEACTWTAAAWNYSGVSCTAQSRCLLVVDLNGDKGPNSTMSTTNQENGAIQDRFYLQIYDETVAPAGALADAVMFK